MKASVIVALTLGLAGCATRDQTERDRLTDRIEDRVKLPVGAMGLSSYARYYAFDEHGLVTGIYVPGYQPPNPHDTCEELLADYTSRAAPCPTTIDDKRLLAGQRAWVEHDSLPLVLDGGCSVVTVIYDPRIDKVTSATCNGLA